MDDPICYELRLISMATGTSVKRSLSLSLYSPKSFPSFKASMELSFSRVMHATCCITVRDFCSAQHMQLLPWPADSPDMSPIEHVWDLVGRRLARDPRPEASKDELLLRIQSIWNSLPQADIQNLFDSMSRLIVALIAARGGYTKY
ncbi:transposable element Tcb2 transposase [Trichonephila clavipes]|nr:transposable element Tcb2 transposase [Trichonephila clavipes]